MVVCPNLLSLGVCVWPSPSSASSLVHQTPLLPLWCGRLPCQIEIFTGYIFQILTLLCRQPYGWLAQSLLLRSLASYFFLLWLCSHVVLETVSITNENLSLYWQRSPFCNISVWHPILSHRTWVCVSSLSLISWGALAHFTSLSLAEK